MEKHKLQTQKILMCENHSLLIFNISQKKNKITYRK